MDQWMGYGNTYIPQAQSSSMYSSPQPSNGGSPFLNGGGGQGNYMPSTTFSSTYGQYPGINSNPYPSASQSGGGYGFQNAGLNSSMIQTLAGTGNPALDGMMAPNWGNINQTIGMGGANGFAGNPNLGYPGGPNGGTNQYVNSQDQNFFNNTNWLNQSQKFGQVFDQYNLLNQMNPNQGQAQATAGVQNNMAGGWDVNPGDFYSQLGSDYANQYNYFQSQGAFGTPTAAGNMAVPAYSSNTSAGGPR